MAFFQKLFKGSYNLFSFRRLVLSALEEFFKENPALVYSLLFLLGISAKLQGFYFIFLLPLILKNLKQKIVCLSFLICAFLFCSFYYPSFPAFENKKPCLGLLKISSITPAQIYNKTTLLYKGKLIWTHLDQDKTSYKNIPCCFYSPKKVKLDPTLLYQIEATTSVLNYTLFLKIKNFTPQKKGFSLVNLNLVKKRTELKNKIRKALKTNLKDTSVVNFFSALITGSLSDKYLSFCFYRIGLSHILAISGFHFGLLMLLFCFLLRFFIPLKYLPFPLLVILNLYFFYIGTSPSILRAYITIQIALLAQIFNKKNYLLNTLGLALFLELLIDPLNLVNLGFQLSFLSVAAIYIIYPQLSSLFQPKEKKKRVTLLNKTSLFIKESLILTLSINIAIFPLIMASFHKFPFISFFYNLLFPPLCFLSLILVFLSFVLAWVHLFFLSHLLFEITKNYTSFILKIVERPFLFLEYSFYSKNINNSFVIIYLFLVFSLFLFWRHAQKELFSWKFLELI